MSDKIIKLVDEAAKLLDEKKAKDTVVVDVRNIFPISDFFIIASGGSTTQVKALADHVEKKMKEYNIFPARVEGHQEGRWILVDYVDFIVHVFHEEEREFYKLERFCGDAPQKNY